MALSISLFISEDMTQTKKFCYFLPQIKNYSADRSKSNVSRLDEDMKKKGKKMFNFSEMFSTK